MKKTLLSIIAAASIFAACDNGNAEHSDVPFTGDVLILNNGNWGSNDSNIAVYDIKSGALTANAFQKTNDMNLGDLGQDILAVGDEVYIAVNGSQLVFVADKDLMVKKTIVAEADGNRLSPRCLTKGEGKIYVTYYEGYLGEIDPSDGYSVRTVRWAPIRMALLMLTEKSMSRILVE